MIPQALNPDRINFNSIQINRAIPHRILAKQDGQICSDVITRNALLKLSDDVIKIIKDRLIYVTGSRGKTHDLEIKNYEADSFFEYCQSMKGASDSNFITTSIAIASKLAELQTRKSIPDAYLWILEGEDLESSKKVYIIIKAELHEALMLDLDDCKLLKEVFLSPTQKLFKIGVLYELTNTKEGDTSNPNTTHGCLLFDSTWKGSVRRLASYFCNDFLGFSHENIASYQVASLYEEVQDFINKNIENESERMEAMERFNGYLTLTDEIHPDDVAEKFTDNSELGKEFKEMIHGRFPGAISKDLSLVEERRKKYKINFENQVAINGPAASFGRTVEVVDTPDKLRSFAQEILTAANTGMLPSFTVVRIQGKPLIN